MGGGKKMHSGRGPDKINFFAGRIWDTSNLGAHDAKQALAKIRFVLPICSYTSFETLQIDLLTSTGIRSSI